MAETFTYNHADIARYVHQQMTPEEMHAFEVAMMDDPFLADALEGYRTSDNALAGKHLTKIEEEIRGRKERAKVIPIVAKRNSWLRIAALFILIAGAGIIVFKSTDNASTKNTLAKSEAPIPTIQNDSIKAVPDQALTRHSNEIFSQNEVVAQKAKPSSSPLIVEYKTAEAGAASAASISEHDSALFAMEDKKVNAQAMRASKMESAPAMRDMSMNYQAREFRGRVVAPDGGALPYANVRSNNNVNTMTDNNGNFTIKAPDTVIEVNVSSLGYASTNKQIRSAATSNEIILKADDNTLAEVVTVGKSAEKKKEMKANGNAFKDSATTGPEPEGGWQSFQDYVYANLKKVRDTTDSYSGDVLVEFTIDEKGKPEHINVAQNVNKLVADKAVQLIQKGPKWKRNAKSNKAKVLIKF